MVLVLTLLGLGLALELRRASLNQESGLPLSYKVSPSPLATPRSPGVGAGDPSPPIDTLQPRITRPAFSPKNSPVETAFSSAELAQLEKQERQQVEREKAYQTMLQNAQKRLPRGEFFHTAPAKLTADMPVSIEAGIAHEVTQALLTHLHMKGQPSIVKDVPYNLFL
ncbi:hypothetical protein H6F76_01505 [Leptolyngbya sp. FACHB-321]|uniref:hypothetical protein n=1 Tax=Leptolyngbya sp. FACHB-321 TaxID=2692807 RepID=UPI0016899AC6|nr:hypothetical protein [Leptolyngbya sp. FACHB-321]MBD2033741.1 hypothetical protein [Leptolyngbya sp. FACHB-321]